MESETLATEKKKRIALVAHDNKKKDLLEWARFNRDLLAEHQIFRRVRRAPCWSANWKFPSPSSKAGHWAAISR